MCSAKDLQNFVMQSLPLYISCLISMVLIDDIVDIENPDRICLPTFVVDEFSGSFYIHQTLILNIQDLHE